MIHETITFISKFLLYISLNIEVSHLPSGSQKFHGDPVCTAMFQVSLNAVETHQLIPGKVSNV